MQSTHLEQKRLFIKSRMEHQIWLRTILGYWRSRDFICSNAVEMLVLVQPAASLFHIIISGAIQDLRNCKVIFCTALLDHIQMYDIHLLRRVDNVNAGLRVYTRAFVAVLLHHVNIYMQYVACELNYNCTCARNLSFFQIFVRK